MMTAPGLDLETRSLVKPWHRFFWYIGGFDASTLATDQCQALRSKYSSIGALVFLTALLASCSGGYAVYTVFRSLLVAAILAVIWGLMILSLDRFLVSSTRRLAVLRDFYVTPEALPPYRSQTPWRSLLLRLPVAIMIGLVVAKPIEARLLRPWIDSYLSQQKEKALQDVENNTVLKHHVEQVKSLNALIASKDTEISQRRTDRVKESDGTGGSHKVGTREVFAVKEKAYNESVDDRNELMRRLDKEERESNQNRKDLTDAVNKNYARSEHERSIISDLAVIQELGAGGQAASKTQSQLVQIVSIFLTGLFVFIECIPVLAKGISSFDPYDAALQEREHTAIMDSLVESRRKYAESSLKPK